MKPVFPAIPTFTLQRPPITEIQKDSGNYKAETTLMAHGAVHMLRNILHTFCEKVSLLY